MGTHSKTVNFLQFLVYTSLILINEVKFISTQRFKGAPRLDPTRAALQQSYLQLFDRGGYISSDTSPGGTQDLPDYSNVSQACPKDDFFFNTNPKHWQAVQDLQKIISKQKSATDFIRVSGNLKNQGGLNAKVWLAAVIGATESRPDTRGLEKPALVEVMPDRFVHYDAINQLKQQADEPEDNRTCVKVDERFGRDNGRENSLWYFREDIMLNSYHWYWHMAYPAFSTAPRVDRRGEMFYYMHHHVIARYEAERIVQGLPRLTPLVVQNRTVISDGYYAHLNDTNSRRPFSDRPNMTTLHTIGKGNGTEDPLSEGVLSSEKSLHFIRRLENAIDAGSFNDSNGNKVFLRNYDGIDVLVDVTEACLYSKNQLYFGRTGVHNEMHTLISFVIETDSQGRKIPPGVMADTSTSMRDPIFYRWHKFLDDLFDRHKQTLPPYIPNEGLFPLSYPAVKITSIKVESARRNPGVLNTFWSEKEFDLSRGLDLGPRNTPLRLCVKHLDHEPFQYNITFERRRQYRSSDTATVRIYMAPRYDSSGNRFSMDEQRLLFFVLDIFTVNLNQNRDTIIRNSQDSALTIPFARSYNELQSGAYRPFCGCGFPHHLLIPKGSDKGTVYDLFATITADDNDIGTTSNSNNTSTETPINGEGTDNKAGEDTGCLQAPILCGLYQEKYPYKLPMNYPFDRVPYSITVLVKPSIWWWEWKQIRRRVANLDEYIGDIPNMATTQVTVIHNNSITSKPVKPVKQ